jgi:hypothetical protein
VVPVALIACDGDTRVPTEQTNPHAPGPELIVRFRARAFRRPLAGAKRDALLSDHRMPARARRRAQTLINA